MKHKVVKLSLIIAMIFCLSACGTEQANSKTDTETQTDDKQWKSVYAEIIQDIGATEAEDIGYALIYITDDDIPELVTYDKKEYVCKIYLYNDGEVYVTGDNNASDDIILDNMSPGAHGCEYYYLEKENRILQFVDSEVTYYEMNGNYEFEMQLSVGKEVIVNGDSESAYYYMYKDGESKEITQEEYIKWYEEELSEVAIHLYNLDYQNAVDILAQLIGGGTESTSENPTNSEEVILEDGELTVSDYQEVCTNMMSTESAYGSKYEKMAANMAQTIVSAKIIEANTSYRMVDITEENQSKLIYALGYSTARSLDEEWGVVSYGLKDYRDELNPSEYGVDRVYPFVYDKEDFVKLIASFYENITMEDLVNDIYHTYPDYGDYIGVDGSDGAPWEYFDAYDIKENDNYILIHAACYTGNNGGGENVYLYTIKALFEKKDDSMLGLQAVYVEGYENNITEHVVSSTASSELPDYNAKIYRASNIVDGDYTTPWVENVDGVGVGESVQLKLDQKTWIQEFLILSGYQSSMELFDMNGYVSRISVDFGNGVVEELDCLGWYDEYMDDKEYRCWDKISLDRPVYTDTITITILDAVSGNKYSDTCISEIELH